MISFIVPTIGRDSLKTTLQSIECYPGDEILVIGQADPTIDDRPRYVSCLNGGDYGGKERNVGIGFARQPYLAFIDDDDVYTPGTRQVMEDAITQTPGCPVLFRMRYPNGITLWQDKQIRCGNVSTQMILVPNDLTRLGSWGLHYAGDFDFLSSLKWSSEEIVWRPEITVTLGFNPGPHA
jgi:glycosyltransferase involved in cell wall biosynthesis